MRYELIVSRYVNLSYSVAQENSCVPSEDEAFKDFQARINAALANGASLHGGTNMSVNLSGYAIFTQAVVYP